MLNGGYYTDKKYSKRKLFIKHKLFQIGIAILLTLIFLNVRKAQNENVDTFVLGNEYITLELTSAFWDTFYATCDFDSIICSGSNIIVYPHIEVINFDTTEVIITYADTSSFEIVAYNHKLDRLYQRYWNSQLYWVFGYETEGNLLDDRKKPIDPKYIILDYKPLKWKTK